MNRLRLRRVGDRLVAIAVLTLVQAVLVTQVVIGLHADNRLLFERVIPVCQEDAVLLGAGSFENGRYSTYVCGPAADDYSEGVSR